MGRVSRNERRVDTMNGDVLARPDVDQDNVLAELERILARGCLGQAESLSRLLRYLVVETLAGRSNRLKEYTLGVEVFQRGVDFDPRVDTIVRTQARRLRAKLQEFYSGGGGSGDVVIDLPKGTYVPRFHRPRVADPVVPRPPFLRTLCCRLMAAALLILVVVVYGYRLWSSSGERGIAGESGDSADTQIGPQSDPEAYRLYLKGRLGNTIGSASYLDDAIRLTPHFAAAHLAKAELFVRQSSIAAAPAADLLPKARDAALRAIEFGSDFKAVHGVLATVAAYHDWDWEVAEKEYLRALALNPQNGFIRLQYAKLLAVRGRSVAALEQVDRIGSIEHRAAVLVGGQAGIFYFLRQYDRAIAHCRAVLEAMPEAGDCSYWMGRAFLSKGMAAEAVSALEHRVSTPGMGFAGPIAAYLAAGKKREALRLRADVEALAKGRYVSAVSLAGMYFSFGERDEAFRQLDRALQLRDPSLITLKVEPAYDEVRSDPRFQNILRRLRL